MKVTLKEYLNALRKSKPRKTPEHSQWAQKEKKIFDLKQSCQMVLPEEEQEFKIRSMFIKTRQNDYESQDSYDMSHQRNIRLGKRRTDYEKQDDLIPERSIRLKKRQTDYDRQGSPQLSPQGNIRLKSSERAAFSEIFIRKRTQTRVERVYKVTDDPSLSQSQVIYDTKQFISHINKHSEIQRKQRRHNMSEKVHKTTLVQNKGQDKHFQKYEAFKASLGIK